MTTLQLDKNKARSLYPGAAPEFRQMLEDTFGKDFFIEKITDRVKTFEDACRISGGIPISLALEPDPQKVAEKKLELIIRVLNEGWKPNWDNGNECKYYPYFEKTSKGFVLLSVSLCYQSSRVGSRLCFKSRELAQYAATQFQSLYNQYLTF